MKVLRDNGLTIVLLLATLATIFGMLVTGLAVYNEELARHGAKAISFAEYVTTGHFLSALFENWESEFLQMSAYVVLTAFLFQRGSAESKDPDESSPQDADPAGEENRPDAPFPVRLGGLPRLLVFLFSRLRAVPAFCGKFRGPSCGRVWQPRRRKPSARAAHT